MITHGLQITNGDMLILNLLAALIQIVRVTSEKKNYYIRIQSYATLLQE